MGTQLKAFGLLIAILMIVDGLAFGGYYRVGAVQGMSSFLGSFGERWNVGHGRDWTTPAKPKRD